MKNMAGKAWEEKLKSEVQSAKEGNGFFGFGGSGINPTNPSPGPNDGNPNNGNPNNGSGGAAMGGSKPLKQNAIDGKKQWNHFRQLWKMPNRQECIHYYINHCLEKMLKSKWQLQ